MASPLTGQTQAALIRLYDQAKHTTDSFILERIDRALDEIVRLNSTDPPAWQIRSAMANASKVITSRRQILCPWPPEICDTGSVGAKEQEDVTVLRAWLRVTRRVNERQRTLLTLLADGHDPIDIAAHYHLPVARVREHISRARRAARAGYALDTDAA